MATATAPIDTLALAKKIYELDPDWYWSPAKVQVFIAFEELSSIRVGKLVAAAEGLSVFVNTFERDLPLSTFSELIREISTHGISVDAES